MNVIQTVSVSIFALTLILIATEKFHRTYVALMGSGAMLLAGAVKAEEVLQLIDIDILAVIVGMMILVRGAENSGVFNRIATKIMKSSRSINSFAVILMSFTMVLSILLNNIGAMLISATITIPMTRSLKLKPDTFLIFQSIIANLGGLMLLMSSIPNIIVAVEGGLSFSSFVIKAAPVGIILFIFTTLIFIRVLGSELEESVVLDLRSMEFQDWVKLSIKDYGEEKIEWRQIISAVVMALTIIGFAVYDLIGLTPAIVALAGGLAMILFSGEGPTEYLQGIDWSTIFFLAGLFVIINGMDNVGLIEMLSTRMLDLIEGLHIEKSIAVMWLSALPSGIIDNIPLTATFAPMISRWIAEGVSKDVWWGLVLGANIGGCLTPIGSPSSIIALGVAEQEGYPISLSRFFKICLGITTVNLCISTLYLYLI